MTVDARVTAQGLRLPTPAMLPQLPPVRAVRTRATPPRLLFLTTSIQISGRHLAGCALIWIGRRLRQHDNRQDSTVPPEPGSPAT